MMLADVYCIYNRARGTSLISPDDLLRACRLLDEYFPLTICLLWFSEKVKVFLHSANSNKPNPSSLGLPLQFRRFESGLLAVQWKSFSDSAFIEKLKLNIDRYRSAKAKGLGSMADPIVDYFPLTTTQFALNERMSIALATQFLLVRSGTLIIPAFGSTLNCFIL